jgi:hypothetical protein
MSRIELRVGGDGVPFLINGKLMACYFAQISRRHMTTASSSSSAGCRDYAFLTLDVQIPRTNRFHPLNGK